MGACTCFSPHFLLLCNNAVAIHGIIVGFVQPLFVVNLHLMVGKYSWTLQLPSQQWPWPLLQAVIVGLVEMTEGNSTLLVPVLEAISNITAQDTGQVLH